jgi:hypothetical protein
MDQLSRTQPKLSAMPTRNLRFRVNWTLTAAIEHGILAQGQVVDISTTGLQVRILLPHLLGKVLQVRISPTRDIFIVATLEVVRVHDEKDASFYYGTRILDQNCPPVQGCGSTLLHEILLKMRRAELAPDFAHNGPSPAGSRFVISRRIDRRQSK